MRNRAQPRLAVLRKLLPSVVVGVLIGKLAASSWASIGVILVLVVVGVAVAPSEWLTRMVRALTGHAEDETARRVDAKEVLGGHRRDGQALLSTKHLYTAKEFRGMARRWATETDVTIQASYGLTEAENFYSRDEDPRTVGTEEFISARIRRLGELIARDTIPLRRGDSS